MRFVVKRVAFYFYTLGVNVGKLWCKRVTRVNSKNDSSPNDEVWA